jgi:dihydrofolate reductase
MRKLIVMAHISLDGFVAGTRGEFDGFDTGEENLMFVADITDHADAALLGRVSYQLLDANWPQAGERPNATPGEVKYSGWYNTAEKYVVSTTLKGTPAGKTTIISNSIVNEILRIKDQPGKDILLFGSPSVFQSIFEHDLIDGYWIFINPVTFGKGIPLFAPVNGIRKLKLVTSRVFANGEMALYFIPGKR